MTPEERKAIYATSFETAPAFTPPDFSTIDTAFLLVDACLCAAGRREGGREGRDCSPRASSRRSFCQLVSYKDDHPDEVRPGSERVGREEPAGERSRPPAEKGERGERGRECRGAARGSSRAVPPAEQVTKSYEQIYRDVRRAVDLCHCDGETQPRCSRDIAEAELESAAARRHQGRALAILSLRRPLTFGSCGVKASSRTQSPSTRLSTSGRTQPSRRC